MAFPYREIYHLTQEEFDLVRRYAKWSEQTQAK
jgi:hypothetical protein